MSVLARVNWFAIYVYGGMMLAAGVATSRPDWNWICLVAAAAHLVLAAGIAIWKVRSSL